MLQQPTQAPQPTVYPVPELGRFNYISDVVESNTAQFGPNHVLTAEQIRSHNKQAAYLIAEIGDKVAIPTELNAGLHGTVNLLCARELLLDAHSEYMWVGQFEGDTIAGESLKLRFIPRPYQRVDITYKLVNGVFVPEDLSVLSSYSATQSTTPNTITTQVSELYPFTVTPTELVANPTVKYSYTVTNNSQGNNRVMTQVVTKFALVAGDWTLVECSAQLGGSHFDNFYYIASRLLPSYSNLDPKDIIDYLDHRLSPKRDIE